jgi:rare lipoprotein A
MASHERSGRWARIGVICLMLLPIHTLPLLAAEKADAPVVTGVPQKTSVVKRLIGIASYYAKRLKGKRTTSGERYQPEKLTAAHDSLPLGTKVRVKNLDNDKEVTVVINDRCRKKSFPFIDLSKAAAKKLGFFGAGKAKVAIIPLKEEES